VGLFFATAAVEELEELAIKAHQMELVDLAGLA
jgi:hypothetical protein